MSYKSRDKSPRRMTHFVMGMICTVLASVSSLQADNGRFRLSPHGSPISGVYRVTTSPRGSCAQCHSTHDGGVARPYGLFQINSNDLCMNACHAEQPTGASAGYPAQESDRMPIGSTDPGYFEYNTGGIRVAGLANLVRWPGRTVWQNSLYSAHYADPDMPVRDLTGVGSCDNCHNVHGGSSTHDMLDTTYSGIATTQIGTAASSFQLCFSCHNIAGPIGMNESSKRIADYYDRSINPQTSAGHGISMGGGYVPNSGRLPCYDCHNPHGSQGYGGGEPNGSLISDQRPGWYGLTDVMNNNTQARRFCFGCHKSSDNQGGGVVEGLVLQPLSSATAAHAFSDSTHCYDCHGRDYTSSSSFNVHNPALGDAVTNPPAQGAYPFPEATKSSARGLRR